MGQKYEPLLYRCGQQVLLQDGAIATVCMAIRSPFRGLIYRILRSRNGQWVHDEVSSSAVLGLSSSP
jgi:hypothetical protein